MGLQVLAILERHESTPATDEHKLKAKLTICSICSFILACRLQRRLTTAFSSYQQLFSAEVGRMGNNQIFVYTKEQQTLQQNPITTVGLDHGEDTSTDTSNDDDNNTITVDLAGFSSVSVGDAARQLVEQVIDTRVLNTKVQLGTDFRDPPEFVRIVLSLLGYHQQEIKSTALSLLLCHFEQS